MDVSSIAWQAACDPTLNWEVLDDDLIASALDAEAADGLQGRTATTAAGPQRDADADAAAAAAVPAAARDDHYGAAAAAAGAGRSSPSLARLQRHLASSLPMEWTVTVARFDGGGPHGSSGGGGGGAENAPPRDGGNNNNKRARLNGGAGPPRQQWQQQNQHQQRQQQQQQQHQQQQQKLRGAVAATPGLFCAAAACPSTGVYAFGGLLPATGTRVVVSAADGEAWASEAGPMRQPPDHSRVLRAGELLTTRLVARAAPAAVPGDGGGGGGDGDDDDGERAAAEGGGAAGATAAGDWRLTLPRDCLSVGLVGHSAVAYRGRLYVWGGQLDDAAAAYARPAGEGCWSGHCETGLAGKQTRQWAAAPWLQFTVQLNSCTQSATLHAASGIDNNTPPPTNRRRPQHARHVQHAARLRADSGGARRRGRHRAVAGGVRLRAAERRDAEPAVRCALRLNPPCGPFSVTVVAAANAVAATPRFTH